MAIKDLLNVTKADRYTADGRDKLNEALQADVEDRTYKTGEISQKTGLQKQPDGSWAPPKNGAKAEKQSKPAAKKRPKAIRWSRENMQTMHENAEYITPQQADNFYHQYGLDKTGEHKDSKGWLIKEYKNDDGDIYRAKYNQENKYIGYDFLPKGSAENPGDESKPAEQNKPATRKSVDKEKLLDTLSFDLVDTTADIEEEYNAVEHSDNSSLPEFVRQEIERDYVNKTNGEKWTDEEKDIIAEEVSRRIKQRQSKDAAPRQLTGDCKIRVRKA